MTANSLIYAAKPYPTQSYN